MLLAAALLTACTRSAPPQRLSSPAGLLDWISTHRDHAGLVVLSDGSAQPEVALNPESLFPLASTKKVLILATFAQQVVAGHLSEDELVPVSAVERYYWAGTDGGAHPAAALEWQRDLTGGNSVPLSAVARAMIRWSDNAAADYLLARVGGPDAVAQTAQLLGMSQQEPLASILGEFRSWSRNPQQWLAASPADRSHLAEVAESSAAATALPSVSDQRRLAEADVAGAPIEWAKAMRSLAAGSEIGPAAAAIARRYLDWPRTEFPHNREVFDLYMTKGGSLPGVITEVSYVRSLGAAQGTTVALFMRNLPPGIESALHASFEQQSLIRELATDPSFRAKAVRMLRS